MLLLVTQALMHLITYAMLLGPKPSTDTFKHATHSSARFSMSTASVEALTKDKPG